VSFEYVPHDQSPSEDYLALIKEVLILDGFNVSSELTYGGYEYYKGRCYISVYFTDERFGDMKKIVPSQQADSCKDLPEV
jgi:hypothetical protein